MLTPNPVWQEKLEKKDPMVWSTWGKSLLFLFFSCSFPPKGKSVTWMYTIVQGAKTLSYINFSSKGTRKRGLCDLESLERKKQGTGKWDMLNLHLSWPKSQAYPWAACELNRSLVTCRLLWTGLHINHHSSLLKRSISLAIKQTLLKEWIQSTPDNRIKLEIRFSKISRKPKHLEINQCTSK